jgi:ABC-type oligopeptide transport system substrate-binding subunit/class 3 adenylate cyclase
MSPVATPDGLPHGTVTFLFTDIEGSTELLKQLGKRYKDLLVEQRTILRETFSRWDGTEVDTQGDSFFYSFTRASDAIHAAVEAQRAIDEHEWPEGVYLPIRMGLHTGEPLNYEEGYIGMDVHRAARIAAAGHGGQILLSETTAPLILDILPKGVSTVDLGRHRLKDMYRPEHITQLVLEDRKRDYPPLNSLEVLPSYFQSSIQLSPAEFLTKSEQGPQPPVFVAREREMARLDRFLDQASQGEGCVVFVSGGPGRGKTALMEAFGRHAADSRPDVLVALGSCSAFRGVGDPFQPFRQILSMLCGDVERAWATGSVSREAAMNLWSVMPTTARTIVESAPDLLDTFINSHDLSVRLSRALESRPSWLGRLSHLGERQSRTRPEREKNTLFDEYERVLKGLCREHTLVLLLDDLQWVDSASLDLLFHLKKCVGNHSILIIGAFRPEEVALERGGKPHPLVKVLGEFKRQFGENVVGLSGTSEIEARQFVDDLLDAEPNRLGADFRSALFAHTSGHPLFTVESLRNLQERESLVKDQDGAWVDTAVIDWSSLPARIEGVIEERIGRLGDDLKRILEVASVEGVVFTSHAIAGVEGIEERSLLRELSQELDKRHRLIQEHGILQIDGQSYYQYQFRHELFQQHLYSQLGAYERSALHKDVGVQLEGIYQDRSWEIAPQLAAHFVKAGDPERALKYFILAGDQARMIYANAEAIGHYQRALEVLQSSDRIDEKARLYMKLGLVFTASFQNEGASRAYDHAFEIWEDYRNSEKPADWGSSPKILRMAIREPITLDPGNWIGDSSRFVLNQIYEGLTTVDDEFNVLPAAAARWEILDEGRRYVFYLQEGLRWSDGTQVVASDFEQAWKRNLRQRTFPGARSLLYTIKNARAYGEGELSNPDEVGVFAIDEFTLEVQLESSTAYLPYLFSLPVAAPLHQFSIQNEVDLEAGVPPPITNGAFYLSEYIPGEKLILRRNPFYRGRFPGNVTQVESPFISEYAASLDEYGSDRVDALDMIASDIGTISRARARFRDELTFIPQLNTFYLTFRMDQHPFNDVAVRKAFAHAIDKVSFTKNATRGSYAPAGGGFVPPGMPAHSESVGIKFDVTQAKQCLKEAGYADGKGFPKVVISSVSSTSDNPIVPFLINSWKDILNVEVSPNPLEWEHFLDMRSSDPSALAVNAWSADYPDPDNFLRALFHSEEGINPGRWYNKEFDQCVEKAMVVLDQGQRVSLYRRADEILVTEEVAIVPIYYSQGRMLAKPWVSMPRIPPAMLQLKEVMIQER